METSDYVKRLGGTDNLVAKIDTLRDLATNLCPESIDDLFISEFKNAKGKHIFENAWFFSASYILESKKIIDEDVNIDIMSIEGYIDKFEIDSNKYNYKEATDESSLTVTAYIGRMVAILKATGFNCDILWELLHKYFVPNLYIDRE